MFISLYEWLLNCCVVLIVWCLRLITPNIKFCRLFQIQSLTIFSACEDWHRDVAQNWIKKILKYCGNLSILLSLVHFLITVYFFFFYKEYLSYKYSSEFRCLYRVRVRKARKNLRMTLCSVCVTISQGQFTLPSEKKLLSFEWLSNETLGCPNSRQNSLNV